MGFLIKKKYIIYKYDLSNINLKQAPITEALTEQKYNNDLLLRFLIRCIENSSFYSERLQVEGVFKDVPISWGNGIVTKDVFREQYSNFAQSSGHKYIENDNIITKKIKDWIPDLNNNIKPMINGIQTPSYKFPSIQKCKESINKELGHEWNWN